MKKRILMSCGHFSGASCAGEPVCAICRISDGAHTPAGEGARYALCINGCGERRISTEQLNQFRRCNKASVDLWDCGCKGGWTNEN